MNFTLRQIYIYKYHASSMVILKFKARDFLLKDERRGKSIHSKKNNTRQIARETLFQINIIHSIVIYHLAQIGRAKKMDKELMRMEIANSLFRTTI